MAVVEALLAAGANTEAQLKVRAYGKTAGAGSGQGG